MQPQSTHPADVTAQPFRDSGRLLESLVGLFNGRAWLLLILTFLPAIALWKLAASVPLSVTSMLVFTLSVVIAICGCNAAGIVMSDEVKGLPLRSWRHLWRYSLVTSHQLAMVLLTVVLLCLLLVLALSLLLLSSRLPVLGAFLYMIVVPAATVIASGVLFVFPPIVVCLIAPAIWRGFDANACLAQVWSFLRWRLPVSAAWVLVLAAITLMVFFIALGLLTMGSWLISGISASLLSTDHAWPAGFPWSAQAIRAAGATLLNTENPSLFVITAISFACPVLVALRGVCIVYEHVEAGLLSSGKPSLASKPLATGNVAGSAVHDELSLRPAGSHAVSGLRGVSDQSVRLDVEPERSPIDASADGLIARAAQASLEALDLDLGQSPEGDSRVANHCPRCCDKTLPTDSYCGSCGQALR